MKRPTTLVASCLLKDNFFFFLVKLVTRAPQDTTSCPSGLAGARGGGLTSGFELCQGVLWRLEPSCPLPDISLVYISEKGGRRSSAGMLQPTALPQGLPQRRPGNTCSCPSRLLIFQKRLTADASPGPSQHSPPPTPTSTQKAPRKNSTPVQGPCPGPPLLTFPRKSPLVPKHVPQKHKVCPRSQRSPCLYSSRTHTAH